jgi:hypothetical protein
MQLSIWAQILAALFRAVSIIQIYYALSGHQTRETGMRPSLPSISQSKLSKD